MDIQTINTKLLFGKIDEPGLFPSLAKLRTAPYIFNHDFGLNTLPTEPGILLIRGARQYGKSTWLEQSIYKTIQEFGPGSAFYLNGDMIADVNILERMLVDLASSFPQQNKIRRIFIDEITSVQRWELALKRLSDRGILRDVLVVTTGSKATDLRRGAEKLPGRKGKLARTTYLFTPISYQEFHNKCGKTLGENTIIAYLLSGGSPVACSALATDGNLPEYIIELTRDWIEGEIAAAGRLRAALLNIFSVLFRFGGTPVGQAKLAREAGLANNTVASGYIELLNDLGCVVPAYPWDTHRKILILRKPCKYHITNLLAGVAYHPARIRSIQDFLVLPAEEQGMWLEWLVAQELLRRAALNNVDILAPLAFWQSNTHEVDFVAAPDRFIEVKRGKTSALEFAWFAQSLAGKQLTVINPNTFTTETTQGISLEKFLLESA